jgi:Zn-dependent protease/CBS domain-containing protein
VSGQQPQQRPVPAGIPAGKIFGVPLVVSPAWIVVVVLATLALPAPIRSRDTGLSVPWSYVVAFTLVVLVYAAVLAHEASHVLVAKALGMKVGRVVLQLLGAVSEVLEESSTAGREYLVAAVGPLTSVLLAGIAAAIGSAFPVNSVGWILGMGCATINGVVAAFNLLPGLPLDGGRVLRALLWHLTGDRMRGLLIAGYVGRGVAIVVAGVGFYAPGAAFGDRTLTALYLFLIALFIWTNASVSIAQARVAAVLPTLNLARLIRPALTVEAQLPLAEAVRRARAINARALVVVDGRDRWSGIVSEAAVQATPVERQPWMSVADLSRPIEDGLVLDPGIGGEQLMDAVQRVPASEYLIKAPDGSLGGVLSRVDLVAALRAAGVR